MENKVINLGKLTVNGKNVLLKENNNGCLECISHCKDKSGYTRIQYNGKQDRLFRVLYEIKYGEIPKGMLLRHTCDNPSCCNIEHLIMGTSYDNVHDMIDRKRSKYGTEEMKNYGSKNGQSKLTENQVLEIYNSSISNKELAKIYNVSTKTINNIKNGKYWKWLTCPNC